MNKNLKFKNNNEYKEWAQNQDWYQSISLSCGYKTPGNIDSEKRENIFSEYDFKGKRVLDIGCNSGLYCLMAKRMGASEVIGVDIDKKRIKQAEIIAANENQEITYFNRGIDEIADLGKFDIVICIAVLTEIQDILGSIQRIKDSTRGLCLLEMDIATPLVYLPRARKIWRYFKQKSSLNTFADARKSKRGWMLSPSMGLLKELFGEEFVIKDLGMNLRYQLIEVISK